MITLDTKNFLRSIYKTEFNQYLETIDYNWINQKIEKWISDDEVGFFSLPRTQKSVLIEIQNYLRYIPKKIDTFVLIGIGGSALAAITFHNALKEIYPSLRNFICLENVDPIYNQGLIKNINPKKTLVNVVSKSGGTSETIVNFLWIYKRFKEDLKDDCNKHFVFTSNPNDGLLKKVAREERIHCFSIPENVGGRFSVLTPVALLMSEFFGYETLKMLEGADRLYHSITKNYDENFALQFALIHHFLFTKKSINISVLMPYSNQLKEFTNWYKQLWAESLAKEDRTNKNVKLNGQTPMSAVGAVDQHSLLQLFIDGPIDKIITFVKIKSFLTDIRIENSFSYVREFDILTKESMYSLLNLEHLATSYILSEKKRPNITIEIDRLDSYHLGQLFYFFELSTAISGILYDVNPFNQPGVESGKLALKALLGDPNLSKLKDKIQKY